MQLLIGFILGRAFSQKDGFLMLALLPFIAAILISLGALLFYGANWYESGVAQASIPSAWYEWPWNWPGIDLAQKALSLLDWTHSDVSGQPLNQSEATPVLSVISYWIRNVLGAVLAILVNVIVALLPICVIGLALRSIRRTG